MTFDYFEDHLYGESVRLADIAAHTGTPVYVYSRARIEENLRTLTQAFADLKPIICYAIKANSNLAVLTLLREAGCGFDVVSGGELYRVIAAGADPVRVTFAGAGKTRQELNYAMECGVGQISVESAQELELLEDLAGQRSQSVTAALRVNPGVDPHTHHHISTGHAGSKFGIDLKYMPGVLALAARCRHAHVSGLHIHIGSQIPDPAPLVEGLQRLLELVEIARQVGVTIHELDLGGGFPVAYHPAESVTPPQAFAQAIRPLLEPTGLALRIEPGRFITADAGVLLTQVQFVKHSAGRCVVVGDAGMNSLMRPALYDAYHTILPLQRPPAHTDKPSLPDQTITDVAGPICESSDYLGRDRALPNIQRGDILAVLNGGAYGASMASNYNSQPRPSEVLIEGYTFRVIRRRETWEDLLRPEREL